MSRLIKTCCNWSLELKSQTTCLRDNTEGDVGQAFQEVPNTEIDEFDLHGLCVDQEIEYLDVPMEDPREQQTTAASITCRMKWSTCASLKSSPWCPCRTRAALRPGCTGRDAPAVQHFYDVMTAGALIGRDCQSHFERNWTGTIQSRRLEERLLLWWSDGSSFSNKGLARSVCILKYLYSVFYILVIAIIFLRFMFVWFQRAL